MLVICSLWILSFRSRGGNCCMAGSSFIFVLFGQSDSLQMANFKQLLILWLCECGLIPTWLKTRDGKAERERRGWHLILPFCGFPNSRLLCCLFKPVPHPNSAHYHPLWHTFGMYSPSCLQAGPFATRLVKPKLLMTHLNRWKHFECCCVL